MGSIAKGLGDYWQAKRVLFREGLWPLFLVPGLVSLFYVPLSILVTFLFLRRVSAYVHGNWIPEVLQSGVTFVLLSIVLWVIGIYIGFLVFRNVIMILYSPILSYLSEAVENRSPGQGPRPGNAPGFRWRELAASAGRGTAMSLLTLLFALIGLCTSFLVSLLPLIGGLVATVVMPVMQALLAGLGFCDPALERRGYSVGESLSFAWRNRGRVFGQGLGFTVLLLVPVVGWFLAPAFGVVAGTLGVVDLLGEREDPAPAQAAKLVATT